MNNKVFSIFNGTTAPQGVIKYLDLYNEIYNNRQYNGATSSLAKIAYLSNQNNIRETLLSCLDQYEFQKTTATRINLLMIYLGQMVCYWFLREYKAVKMLQNAVKKIDFNVTWMEKHKGGLKTLVGGIAGIAIVAAGGDPSTGQSVFRGSQMTAEKDEKWTKDLELFEKLKKGIISVNFNI